MRISKDGRLVLLTALRLSKSRLGSPSNLSLPGKELDLSKAIQNIINVLEIEDIRYFEIVWKGTVIGVCTHSSIADVLLEEPGSSFREITKEQYEAFE